MREMRVAFGEYAGNPTGRNLVFPTGANKERRPEGEKHGDAVHPFGASGLFLPLFRPSYKSGGEKVIACPEFAMTLESK
jgi:hypothetical protein